MHDTQTSPGHCISVGRVPFCSTDLPSAAAWVLERARARRAGILTQGISIRLSNAYCVALAEKSTDYARALSAPGVTLPDGFPVSLVMKWAARGTQLRPERVRGPSFFNAVLDVGRDEHIRHYFLGTTSDTLIKLKKQASLRFPDLIICGSFAPPFSPIDSSWIELVRQDIKASNADLVWVALGTPKQDFATTLLASETGNICIGVGAAFDFLAKTTPEAPKVAQRLGLEWLYRLSTEPKRLWRRYLFGNIGFLASAGRNSHRSRTSALAASGAL